MRRLVVVYLTVFIDLLGFGIILPLLPFYAREFGATGLGVGALMTAYSAAQLVGAPLLGRLSDRIGRRPVLLLSLLGSALSLAASGLATSMAFLLAARALAGLFGGSISAAQAYIADVTTRRDRTKAMGLLGASIGMGFVLGPALGAGLGRFGFGTAALAAAALAFVNFLVAIFVLTESKPKEGARPAGERAGLLESLRHPQRARLLASGFLVMLGFVAMESTFALLGAERFGLDGAKMGLVFTFVGVIMVLTQGGITARLAHRHGAKRIAIAGAVIIALSLAALPLAPTFTLVMVALGVLAFGQGLTMPTVASWLSQSTDEHEQGGVLGLSQALSAGARAIGPLIAGALYDVSIGAPYLVAGALSAVAASVLVQAAGPHAHDDAQVAAERHAA